MNDDASRSPNAARIHVFGAGSWGTTLAIVANRAGNNVALYSGHAETVEALRTSRMHPRSLPGVTLPDSVDVRLVDELDAGSGDVVIVAVPVQRMRRETEKLVDIPPSTLVICAAKGIEVGTLLTPLDVLGEVLPHLGRDAIVALSGPNIAPEIAAGQPATTVVASRTPESAIRAQQVLASESFRVYTSSDVIGVQMGGALKNIVAIGAGIAEGLNAGHNAKAAFMTRGIAEIARLGIACGAEVMTFAGLSGIGDLIATCGSTLSRNHTVGRALAEGRSLEDIVASMSETAEGIETTRAALRLADRLGVDVPIICGMHGILFEGISPIQAAAELMNREPKAEG